MDFCEKYFNNGKYVNINLVTNEFQTPGFYKKCGYSLEFVRQNPVNYKYPHDYTNSFVKQEYMPDILKNTKYYIPKTNSKYENGLKNINDKLNNLFEK